MPGRRGQAARRAPPVAPDPATSGPSSPADRRRDTTRRRARALRRLGRAKRLVLASSMIATALSILVLSASPFEWISGGYDLPHASRCTLPGARDPARPLLAAVTLLPVVALWLLAWSRPRSRLYLLLSGALAVLWLYRFLLRAAGC